MARRGSCDAASAGQAARGITHNCWHAQADIRESAWLRSVSPPGGGGSPSRDCQCLGACASAISAPAVRLRPSPNEKIPRLVTDARAGCDRGTGASLTRASDNNSEPRLAANSKNGLPPFFDVRAVPKAFFQPFLNALGRNKHTRFVWPTSLVRRCVHWKYDTRQGTRFG